MKIFIVKEFSNGWIEIIGFLQIDRDENYIKIGNGKISAKFLENSLTDKYPIRKIFNKYELKVYSNGNIKYKGILLCGDIWPNHKINNTNLLYENYLKQVKQCNEGLYQITTNDGDIYIDNKNNMIIDKNPYIIYGLKKIINNQILSCNINIPIDHHKYVIDEVETFDLNFCQHTVTTIF